MYSDVAVIIPARIGSTRLPRKPLQMIGDFTMIEHVVSRVKQANISNIFVATDSMEIKNHLEQNGYRAIMTSEDCLKGSDRVYEAFKALSTDEKINYIVNVQGDMPFIDESVILDIIKALKETKFDIMTSVVRVGMDVALLESNVKVVVGDNNQALYFSRSLIPHGAKEFLYHVGVYGFRAQALEKFVSLPESKNEKTESLEQLRALDNGMTIGVCYSNGVPISVDTPEDLEKAREWWSSGNGINLR